MKQANKKSLFRTALAAKSTRLNVGRPHKMDVIVAAGECLGVEFGGNDVFIGDWYNVTTQSGHTGVMLASELKDFVL